MNRLAVILFFIALISKGLIWVMFIPIWHFPDEQAHFAQINYYAERKQLTNYHAELDLSNEIYLSEVILGTNRDWQGKNNYTFHPSFNIAYTTSLTGNFEDQIRSIPLVERSHMVKRESTFYPPLYYLLSLYPYQLVYKSSLFERVFAVRLLSLGLSVVMVAYAYKFYLLAFKNKILSMAATAMVGFHPMLTFVGSGVNSDALFNTLFSAGIYLGLRTIIYGLSFRAALLMTALIYLSLLTKPQGNILIAIFLPPLIISFLKKNLINRIFVFFVIATVVFFMLPRIIDFFSGNQYLPDVPPYSQRMISLSFINHLKDTIRHTVSEVLPWYWGVFKWLGITLPRSVNRVINRLLFIAVIGIVFKLFFILRKWEKTRESQAFFYFIFVSCVYFSAITIYDYLFIRGNGFSIGIQGRYFFPAISAHMGLILMGLTAFLRNEKWRARLAKAITYSMVFLHLIAIYTVLASYYMVTNLWLFFNQASQYKPLLAKYPYLLLWIIFFASSLTAFVVGLFRMKIKET